MILKETIYDLINTNKVRLALASELNVSENTIRSYINNKSNQLTLASALKIIREHTGLSDSEILTEANTTVGA